MSILTTTPGIGDRLHVCVGPACNNNCVFCIEENRAGRFALLAERTDEDVRRILSSGPRVREVMFVSGEPTLNRSLPRYISWAREEGFEVVGLITNGRRLAYRPYVNALLDAGLNHVMVSIHGPDAKVHDSLTRTRGAFAQTMVGLENLAALRDAFPGLRVHTATCLNRRNFKLVREFIDAMAPLRVDQHVFNVMMPEGRGEKLFGSLMPRYSEVAKEFGRALEGLFQAVRTRVYLLDIPDCTTEDLPGHVRGQVERYFAFEMNGTCPVEAIGDKVDAMPESELYVKTAMRGEKADYSLVAKTFHDSLVRVKRPECGSCRHDDEGCPGVSRLYVERFGWDEFAPVGRKA